MLWRVGDTQLFDLPVGDCGKVFAFDQRLASDIRGQQQAQWPVANAAHDFARSPGLRDLLAQHGRGTEVIGSAPATGQKDDVVLREVNRVNLHGGFDLGLKDGIFQVAFVRRRCQKPAKRVGLNRDSATLDACQVHGHAGLKKLIVRRGHLGTKDARGLAACP